MSTVFLIITSISSMVLQNCLFNHTCKSSLKTNAHINIFNVTVYSVCVLIFGFLLMSESVSVFTLLLGLLFGVITALSNSYKMLALSSGPMNITLLVTTSSMIIPTMSGVFFGEAFSIAKLCVVFVLIGFIYMTIKRNENDTAKINKAWLSYCALAFLFQGTVGVLQKIHQNTEYKNEVSGFLFVAFICAIVFSLLRNRGCGKNVRLGKKTVIIGLICGVCTFCMNYINLKLSGLLPSQLFFPIVNGSAIIISLLMSVLLFKEKLTRRQTVGLCGGILSLIAICIVK